jgi:outer membrane protein assembly factor BamB
LSLDDGTPRWEVPLAEPLAGPLVLEQGWLLARTSAGSLLAFRAADGELIWQRPLGVAIQAPPVVAYGKVFASLADNRVMALDVATGEPAWERRIGGPPNEILAVGGRLYLGADDNFFYCLHTEYGEIAWRWRTGGDVVGAAAADDQRVYFASYDNLLRALDRGNGAQRWKRQLPVRAVGGPIRIGGIVIVRGLAPTLRAFATRDGAPAGEIPSTGELAAPPHVIDTEALPILVYVTRDLAKGATITAVTRSIEPAIAPMAPLPNPVQPPRPAQPASAAAAAGDAPR